MAIKKPTPPPPQPAERFHPGEYIREELEARGWSIETMVERSGLRRDLIEELIAESRPVTRLVALCLANAFGTGDVVWRNLQKCYDGEPRPTSPPPPKRL